jgi:hypothetical protein
MAMSPVHAFGWRCVGSLAVEIVLFCQAVRTSPDNDIPPLYRNTAFIVGRILLAVVAGCIATASGTMQPMQAVAVGAGAPQLILALYRLRTIPDRAEDRPEHSN